uniref:MucR family transcriptional regulator n=1 Tax=Methylobacterium sp. B34 TaxID=95563 RepID=UPI0009FC0D9E|nr:MucR family transcriptional regulator [Methylobacterium sp. B34]
MTEISTTEMGSTVDFSRLAAKIASAYIIGNNVPASDVPVLIERAADALRNLTTSGVSTALASPKTSQARISESITPEALISFEDGKGYKTLKRHLTANGLTPETYRAKWGLPANYPMVAPAYGLKRSAIAKSLILNRIGRENAAK